MLTGEVLAACMQILLPEEGSTSQAHKFMHIIADIFANWHAWLSAVSSKKDRQDHAAFPELILLEMLECAAEHNRVFFIYEYTALRSTHACLT